MIESARSSNCYQRFKAAEIIRRLVDDLDEPPRWRVLIGVSAHGSRLVKRAACARVSSLKNFY